MDISEFLGVAPTAEPSHWVCTVGPHVLTRAGAMQGGALFGVAIVAMEGVAGRPVAWATAQYLSHVGIGAAVDVEVALPVEGHRITQANAVVSARGTVLGTAAAALGSRSFPSTRTWLVPPAVPPPDDCDVVLDMQGSPRSEVWELRRASGRQLAELDRTAGQGRSATWCRVPDGPREVSAGDLAIAGDFLMIHFSDALGIACSGNSLDNTLRVAQRDVTGWILLDANVHHVGNGLGYGVAHLWSEEGNLLGTASQTLVLRELSADGLTARSNRRVVEQ
jgi:acyl-CoA thioesterase